MFFLKFQFSRRIPAVVAGVQLLWTSTHDLVLGAEISVDRVENSECSLFPLPPQVVLFGGFNLKFLVLGLFQVSSLPSIQLGSDEKIGPCAFLLHGTL